MRKKRKPEMTCLLKMISQWSPAKASKLYLHPISQTFKIYWGFVTSNLALTNMMVKLNASNTSYIYSYQVNHKSNKHWQQTICNFCRTITNVCRRLRRRTSFSMLPSSAQLRLQLAELALLSLNYHHHPASQPATHPE